MTGEIKISVIIPCYNQAEYLPEAVESVISQTYSNWECIIVNDGSTDGTEEIARSYCDKDHRIKYYSKENGGLSSARNAGLKIAAGEYIQFLDSDDVIDKEKFKKQIETFKEKSADISVTDYILFKGDITNQFENFLSQQQYNLTIEGLLYEWAVTFVIPIHAGLFNRSFLERNDITFNESVRAREDWIFWCQSALADARFNNLDKKLAFYRVHDKSMNHDVRRMMISHIESIFELDDLLSDDFKKEFRKKISEHAIDQLSKAFGKDENLKKANSLEYKTGFIILYPLLRLSDLIRKLRK